MTNQFETPAMQAARIAQEQQQSRYAAQQAAQTQYPMGPYVATAETVAAYVTQKR